MESLKTKKEIKGLQKYVNKHILRLCKKKKYCFVVKVLDCLERKYRYTGIEIITQRELHNDKKTKFMARLYAVDGYCSY